MFLKLLKELPQMFAIAAIIWGFVLLVFIKNSRKKNKPFFNRHRFTILAFFIALLLTMADIWVFIEYLPTHFKKQITAAPAVSSAELLADSTTNQPASPATAAIPKKDSVTKQEKTTAPDPAAIMLLTSKASIRFLSRGSSEDIEATNHSVAASFNEKTGQLKFTGLIRGFQFENELMQEHFNDKDYMNSEAFPKTSFNGIVQNISAVDFLKDGTYPVTATGNISIHGISKNITVTGKLGIAGGKVSLNSLFKIKRADFGITTDEIADELEITVTAAF